MNGVFSLAPVGSRAFWVLGGVALLLVLLLVLFAWIAWSTRHVEFAVTPDALVVRGTLYGRRIALADLDAAAATRLDLARESGMRLRWRTNGVGLPGFQAGWFRLRNGRRALVFLSDTSRAVHVPTRLGYDLVVSPTDPDAFVAALRAAAAPR